MYHSAALTGMRQLHEGGVAEYEMLQMEVDDLNGLRSGFLRIGAFSSVATHWLPLDAGDRVVGDEGAVAGQILHKELQFLQHFLFGERIRLPALRLLRQRRAGKQGQPAGTDQHGLAPAEDLCGVQCMLPAVGLAGHTV